LLEASAVIVYHGTTALRARKICEGGFQPRKPSRRVWFAQSYGYAHGRAQTQARRAHDRPVVLQCVLDLGALKAALGRKKISVGNGVISIDAPVVARVIRAEPPSPLEPVLPYDLASWLNEALGVKPWKGVRARNPGVERLSKWVVNRVAERRGKYPRSRELFEMARRFLPELLKGCVFDPERASIRRVTNLGEVVAGAEAEPEERDPYESRVLECLDSPKPRRRVRGLEMLAEREDEELFDWCMLFMSDPSPQVRIAAARAMATSPYIDPEILVPLVDAKDRLLRAAAVGALASHLGKDEPEWLELGLKDPEAHVRLAAAAQLGVLDRGKCRAIFELALNDPNPKVVELAEKVLHP